MDVQRYDGKGVTVSHIWYCSGCKKSVEAECDPVEETVKCPKCGSEKNRFTAPERKK